MSRELHDGKDSDGAQLRFQLTFMTDFCCSKITFYENNNLRRCCTHVINYWISKQVKFNAF